MFRRLVPSGLALAALTVSSATYAAAAPQAISLHATDVPKNFRVVIMGKQTAAVLVATTLKPKVYQQHGRMAGYVSEFAPHHSLPAVASLVVQYRTAAGASWELQNVRRVDRSRAVTAPSIGQGTFAYSTRTGRKQNSLVVYGIAFREGVYAIEVSEDGRPGQITLSDVAHYAQIVDSRAKNR
jgi:hypothetical protein